MRDKTRVAETNEFCLVLTPDLGAPGQASDAIREHFRNLAEETRRKLAVVVADLVDRAVEQRPVTPITVTAVRGEGSVRGEVGEQGNHAAFEIPLTG
jgi:hypothetical protein